MRQVRDRIIILWHFFLLVYLLSSSCVLFFHLLFLQLLAASFIHRTHTFTDVSARARGAEYPKVNFSIVGSTIARCVYLYTQRHTRMLVLHTSRQVSFVIVFFFECVYAVWHRIRYLLIYSKRKWCGMLNRYKFQSNGRLIVCLNEREGEIWPYWRRKKTKTNMKWSTKLENWREQETE